MEMIQVEEYCYIIVASKFVTRDKDGPLKDTRSSKNPLLLCTVFFEWSFSEYVHFKQKLAMVIIVLLLVFCMHPILFYHFHTQ